MRRSLAVIATLFGIADAAQAEDAPFAVRLLPLPGDSAASAVRVSDDGRRVVGTSYRSAVPPETLGSHALVIWDDGGLPVQIAPREPLYFPIRISGDGSTVVAWENYGLVLRWTDEEDDAYVNVMMPSAISTDGSVYFGDDYGGEAARWENGVTTRLTTPDHPEGINGILLGEAPDGRVFGSGTDLAEGPDAHDRPFVWDGNTLRWLGGEPELFRCSAGAAVSEDGDFAGACTTPNTQAPYERFPARWSDDSGGPVVLIEANGDTRAISADGDTVVGRIFTGPSTSAGFVWRAGIGTRTIADVLEDAGIDLTDVGPLTTANDVSADGRYVVGSGYLARLPVPAPAPFAGAAAALAMLVLRWRVAAHRADAFGSKVCTS